MSEPVSANSKELQRIEQLLSAKQFDEALPELRAYWLSHPTDQDAMRLFGRLMKSVGNAELSGCLYKLAESEDAFEKDIPNVFEAGFKLIDERELQLAIMLLKRAAEKVPHDPIINYELGFALMSLHQFEEAIQYLELAMPETDDFDTTLNLHVCYTLTRNLQQASEALDAMEKKARDNEQKKEVSHRRMVLKRLEKFQKPDMTPRDWLYVLYGTLLLSEPGALAGTTPGAKSELVKDTVGKSGDAVPTYKDIAWTLIVLEKMLMELGHEFDVIEFYSPMSRPLAEAMGHMLDLPVRSFGGAMSKDKALMIMAWAPNIIGPHKSFMPNSKYRVLFAYAISTLQPLPVTPDVVAEICEDCRLPWSDSSEEEAEFRSMTGKVDVPDQGQAAATDKILAEVAELESKPEIIQTVQKLCDYYKPKRDWLVVGNPENFKERPEYTAEVVF